MIWTQPPAERQFIERLPPEIKEHVKGHCVGYETARLHGVENHAIHSERPVKEKRRKKEKIREDFNKLLMTQLHAYERQQ